MKVVALIVLLLLVIAIVPIVFAVGKRLKARADHRDSVLYEMQRQERNIDSPHYKRQF